MLFFLYPVSLVPLLEDPGNHLLQWQLFGFGPAIAIVLLTLLPAVRRGPAYVRDCGSPWPWPGFPWVLFGTLGLCGALRGYYLCFSLHFVDYADSIFGPYFLAPLLFATAVLLLESGLTNRSSLATNLGLLLPLGMVILASMGHRDDRIYQGFLQLFETGLGGSPLYVAILLVIVFYAVAVARSVRFADEAFTAALVLWAFVGPNTLDLQQFSASRPGPLALAGAWQLFVGLRQQVSWRVLMASWAVIAAMIIYCERTWFTAAHGVLPILSLLATLLTIGLLFDDAFSRFARRVGSMLSLLIVGLIALGVDNWFPEVPGSILLYYPLVFVALLILCGLLVRDHLSLVAGTACFVVWILSAAVRGYEQVRPHLLGLNQLAWGVFFFVLAALISLSKAGLLRLKPGWLKPSTKIEMTSHTGL